jgi:hypothetical protein
MAAFYWLAKPQVAAVCSSILSSVCWVVAVSAISAQMLL